MVHAGNEMPALEPRRHVLSMASLSPKVSDSPMTSNEGHATI